MKQNTIDNGLNANCAIWFHIKCSTRLCRRMLWLDCFSSSFHLSHSPTLQPPIAAQHLLTAKELRRKAWNNDENTIQALVDERYLDDWHSRFANKISLRIEFTLPRSFERTKKDFILSYIYSCFGFCCLVQIFWKFAFAGKNCDCGMRMQCRALFFIAYLMDYVDVIV